MYSEEKLVNFVRGRECFVGLSFYIIRLCCRCMATGWGQTLENGTLEAKIHQVRLSFPFCVSSFDSVIVYFKTLDFFMNLKCKM